MVIYVFSLKNRSNELDLIQFVKKLLYLTKSISCLFILRRIGIEQIIKRIFLRKNIIAEK